ncbi:MAG: nucleotidyltransferase domain-containing protein [Anaerolineae bacterium]
MIPEAARQFAGSCAAQFQDNVVAVVLEGSYARNDEGPDSDIDLYVVVRRLDSDVLGQIGEIVSTICSRHELNPAVASQQELESHPDLFGYTRVKLEGIVLYGELPEIEVDVESALRVAQYIAHDVLMSARHYLVVSEPEERFATGKLYWWNLKPLGFALRFFHLYQTGEYIRSLGDLSKHYPVLTLDPVRDYRQILLDCISVCERIIATQPLEIG